MRHFDLLTRIKNIFYDEYIVMKLSTIKKVFAATTGAVIPLAYVLPVHAQLDPCAAESIGSFGRLCRLNANNLGGIVAAGITLMLMLAVIIALFYLVLGGIRWVTSGGDKAKVESARNHIIAAIIGLVIAFLAFFIIQVALGFFGLNFSNLSIPKIPTL